MTLDPADHFVDPDIRVAETLPASAFSSREFLAAELATLFARQWLLIPPRGSLEVREDPRTLADQVSRRGARAPLSLLDRPLFLQRDWKGGLHCFPNVCTHAWHTLVAGADRERTITCAQHGRVFGCDGKFLSQPGFKAEGDFPRAQDHLRSFPVGSFGPLLFTCLGEPAVPFEAWIAPVRESLGKLAGGMGNWRRAGGGAEARELSGNWKLNAWNYMDKFHIRWLHRAPGGLADAVEMKDYRTELHEHGALQWVYARDPAHGFDPASLPARFRDGDRRVFALWWLLLPNLTLNFYPWGLSVNLYQPVPADPDRTLFLWHHFVADEKKYARIEADWLNSQVDAEDVDAIGQVRRGVKSPWADRARFAPEEETGPHWYHRKIYEGVFGAAAKREGKKPRRRPAGKLAP